MKLRTSTLGGHPETKMLRRSTCFSAAGGAAGGSEAQDTGGLCTCSSVPAM